MKEEINKLSSEELIKKIKLDIEKSGFSAEMKVNSILLKNNFGAIWPAHTYLDKDHDVSREIDFVAASIMNILNPNVMVNVELCIEVKKSEKPWVIFGKKHNKSVKDDLAIGFSAFHLKTVSNEVPGFYSSKLGSIKSPLLNSDFHGTSFHESFKSPQEHSQIYAALMTSIKAAISEVDLINSNNKSYKYEDLTVVNLFLPIVVLEGRLFKSTLDARGEVQVEETDYITSALTYSSKNYVDKGSRKFLAEVITLPGLEKYLQSVLEWQKELFDYTINLKSDYKKQDENRFN